jgi:hypothetical protein
MTTLLELEEISGPSDVGLEELAKPVLVLSALPNADRLDVEPSTCLQAGMQGCPANICIPAATDALIILFGKKKGELQ